MNVNKSDRRDHPGEERGAGQRTPRSGGRTAAERTTRTAGVRNTREFSTRARGVREFPTQGSSALRPQEADQIAERDPVRVWDSTDQPDVGRSTSSGRAARDTSPRLKVAPPLPVAVPRAPFVALILAVVVGGLLGILMVNTKVNENALRLDRLQKQQTALDLQQEQLNKKIAESEAPGNLAAQARKLGLVESTAPAFILPDGRTIGVPQPAGGEPAITSQQGAGG
jgi:hypothetical protein